MGTASTMAVLGEALGLMVPGSASIPAGDPRAAVAAQRAGALAVEALSGPARRPQLRDGDIIAVDVPAGSLELQVPPDELALRAAAWSPPPPPHLRGWPALYAAHVQQAPDGCDLDFLTAPTPGHRQFVEPVVGRS